MHLRLRDENDQPGETRSRLPVLGATGKLDVASRPGLVHRWCRYSGEAGSHHGVYRLALAKLWFLACCWSLILVRYPEQGYPQNMDISHKLRHRRSPELFLFVNHLPPICLSTPRFVQSLLLTVYLCSTDPQYALSLTM